MRNRLSAILGYPVEVRDEAAGTTQRLTARMNRDEFFSLLLQETDFFDPDDSENPEPGEVEAVCHVGDDGAVIRFWSPLSTSEAREAIAANIAAWKGGVAL